MHFHRARGDYKIFRTTRYLVISMALSVPLLYPLRWLTFCSFPSLIFIGDVLTRFFSSSSFFFFLSFFPFCSLSLSLSPFLPVPLFSLALSVVNSPMLIVIVASGGLLMNIVGLVLFSGHGGSAHGHSHTHGSDSGHSHSHKHSHKSKLKLRDSNTDLALKR